MFEIDKDQIKGLGQYDMEYNDCPCFWGRNPGKFVKLLSSVISKGQILDLGAGEGKNAIYLAELGFQVTALECSVPALRNFRARLEECPSEVRERIETIEVDVRRYKPTKQYDTIIAYGLLHCLPNITDARNVIYMMKAHTRVGGHNMIVTFTPDISVPDVQSYLEPTFVESNTLLSWYKDWQVVRVENDVIEESHPTSKISHKHSLCRLLVRRPQC